MPECGQQVLSLPFLDKLLFDGFALHSCTRDINTEDSSITEFSFLRFIHTFFSPYMPHLRQYLFMRHLLTYINTITYYIASLAHVFLRCIPYHAYQAQ